MVSWRYKKHYLVIYFLLNKYSLNFGVYHCVILGNNDCLWSLMELRKNNIQGRFQSFTQRGANWQAKRAKNFGTLLQGVANLHRGVPKKKPSTYKHRGARLREVMAPPWNGQGGARTPFTPPPDNILFMFI